MLADQSTTPVRLTIDQMEKDLPGAIKYMKKSQGHARSAGFRDGMREAGEALDRLSSSSTS
jgi:hypothetical protein